MSGKLNLILGRADTGKTARVVAALKAHQSAGERAILLVPEQYTYEAERLLADALGGLLGVQVFSFDRLCERVLSLSGKARPFLSAEGYRMVIRRAISLKKESLTLFARAAEGAGFAEEAQGIFRDFKRAGLTPDALDALIVRLPEGAPLTEKLSDLSILFRETERYLAERYLSLDDAANEAMRLLPESFVAGAPVYIDGLDRPNKQVLALIGEMLHICPHLTLTLRVDCLQRADDELFEPEREVLLQLRAVAERAGAAVDEERLCEQTNRADPLMRHIERNLFAYPAEVYHGNAEKLTIFGASSRRAEAESLAEAILTFAREKGVRYREMAVIVSDLEAYAGLIRRSCERRGIPIFLDRKRPLTGHAAIDAVLSAVRYVSSQYPAAELLGFLKSGYCACAEEEIEELDLYLKRTGIRGGALNKPFTRANPSTGAERARAEGAALLEPLAKGLARASVREQVRALYAFLEQLHLQETLQQQAEALRLEGRLPEMQEHAQVWNLLISLLDQLDEILGELKVGRAGFLRLLEEGLSGGSIGVVPGTADQGVVGDAVRTRNRRVRALFVVGANDGLFPRPQQNDGLLDDTEIRELQNLGAPVKKTAAELTAADRLDLYTALSKADEYLYVSYAYGDGGNELSPSPLIDRLTTLCPTCSKKSDIESTDALPDCVPEALTLTAGDLRRFREEGFCPSRLPALIEWLTNRDKTRQLTLRMIAESAAAYLPLTISQETAGLLYGKSVPMSASRLESFNSCPFQHFVRYGLRAEDTREFTERAADLGEFYHAVLEAFVNAVNRQAVAWKHLTDAEALAILDQVLSEVIPLHHDGILTENERMKATLFLLIETLRASALAIVGQIRAGSFIPMQTELRFGFGEAFPPIRLLLPDGREALVGGKIDRVDRAVSGGREMIRVVDYKTGGRDFDFAGVLQGLTLQLPLYLMAAAERAETRAGLYYMPISQPVVSDSADDIEGAVTDAFRLKGLTLGDAAVIRASDNLLEGKSTVLYDVKAAGEENFSGSVCTQTELNALIRIARQKSEQTLEQMLSGDMNASPAARKKRHEACEYCDYKSICRFDPKKPGCRIRMLKTIKQDEFFTLIAGGERDALDE
ncbi:MAG: PD-(D/E)XK nuclease family protein [Christensenella sp.]|nr:PD-(D/E)XK nuclease family protein [Christensenella sp.]